MEKRAGKTTSRKHIDSGLEKVRRTYAKAKADYDVASAELVAVQRRAEEAQARMSEARATLLELTEHARVMDLTGSEALKYRGKETNYIVDGKEYHIDANDVNDIRMVPWKEFKKHNSNPDPLDELLADDSDETEELEENKDPKKEALNNLVSLKKQTDNPLAQLEYQTSLSELKDYARGYSLNQREYQYPNWTDQDFVELVSDLEQA